MNRFGRDTSHLEGPSHGKPAGYATDCLEAVERLFGKEWLEQPDGHRLQRLWERRDWLATCELFGLGKSIQNLLPKHEGWLQNTAKKIRSGIENAHGFITEILICGSIGVREGEVYPAPGNQKGFDLVVDFASGFKYYISIKSQGMAAHEAEFHNLSDRLKEAFVKRLDHLGLNGELYIESNQYIKPSTLEFLIDFVGSKLSRPDEYTYSGCKMIFREMFSGHKKYARSHKSNHIFIKCPQHRNALLNAKDKLIKAAGNLKKSLPVSDCYARHLLVRVHSSTDIYVLEEAAKVMLEDRSKDYGFDSVQLIQTSVVRDAEKSQIVTCWKSVTSKFHKGSVRAMQEGRVRPLSFGLPVGLISKEPSKTYITNGTESMLMPPGFYIYQKADIYHLMEQDGDAMVGEWSSPASGIRHHLVYATDEQNALLTSPSVEVEETLII